MTRARLIICTALAGAAIAGCGGDDDEAGAALDYIAPDAAVVVSIETDLEGEQYQAVDELLDSFPIRDELIGQLRRELEDEGTDFEEDVEPLLGEPAFVSIAAEDVARSLGDDEEIEDFLLVWKVSDADSAEEMLSDDSDEDGEIDGNTVYEGDRGAYGLLDGDVLLVSRNRDELEAALERKDGEHLSQEDFDRRLAGLPEEGFVRVGVALEPVLEAADVDVSDLDNEFLERARSIGLVASADDDGLQVELGVAAEGVSEEDVPIAQGDQAPSAVTLPNHVTVGVRDPGRMISVLGQSLPGPIAQGIESQLDIELEDLAEALDEDASILYGPLGSDDVTAIFTSSDEDSLEEVSDAITDALPTIGQALAGEGLESNPVRGRRGLFAADGDSGGVFYYGVVDGSLVVSTNLTSTISALDEEPEEIEGARGAVAVSVDSEEIASMIARQQFGGLFDITPFIEPLGDLIASLRATEDGVAASLRLEVED